MLRNISPATRNCRFPTLIIQSYSSFQNSVLLSICFIAGTSIYIALPFHRETTTRVHASCSPKKTNHNHRVPFCVFFLYITRAFFCSLSPRATSGPSGVPLRSRNALQSKRRKRRNIDSALLRKHWRKDGACFHHSSTHLAPPRTPCSCLCVLICFQLKTWLEIRRAVGIFSPPAFSLFLLLLHKQLHCEKCRQPSIKATRVFKFWLRFVRQSGCGDELPEVHGFGEQRHRRQGTEPSQPRGAREPGDRLVLVWFARLQWP